MHLSDIVSRSPAKQTSSRPGFLSSAWSALGREHWESDPVLPRHGAFSTDTAAPHHPINTHYLDHAQDEATFRHLTKLLTNAVDDDDDEEEQQPEEDDLPPIELKAEQQDISHLVDPSLLSAGPIQNFIFRSERTDARRPTKKRKLDEKERERKSVVRQRFPDALLDDTVPKRNGHNIIEKRYRLNLNAKISALKDVVPTLRNMAAAPPEKGSATPIQEERVSGSVTPQKFNKGTVLEKATEHIQNLEVDNQRLQAENNELRKRLRRLEEQGSDSLPTPRRSFDHGEAEPILVPSLVDASSFALEEEVSHQNQCAGLIPMPESLRKFYGFRPNHKAAKQALFEPPTANPQDVVVDVIN